MWCLCFQNLQDFLWKLGFFGIVSLKDKVMLLKVNFFSDLLGFGLANVPGQ